MSGDSDLNLVTQDDLKEWVSWWVTEWSESQTPGSMQDDLVADLTEWFDIYWAVR